MLHSNDVLKRCYAVYLGVVAVISLGVLFGLIIGSSLLGVAVCLLKW